MRDPHKFRCGHPRTPEARMAKGKLTIGERICMGLL